VPLKGFERRFEKGFVMFSESLSTILEFSKVLVVCLTVRIGAKFITGGNESFLEFLEVSTTLG